MVCAETSKRRARSSTVTRPSERASFTISIAGGNGHQSDKYPRAAALKPAIGPAVVRRRLASQSVR